MKTHILNLKAVYCFFMLAIVASSCKKDEKPETFNPGMSFIVNGTLKEITDPEKITYTLLDNEKTLKVTGILNTSNESVTLILTDFNGKGDYTIGDNASAVYTNGSIVATNSYTANSGTVKITTSLKEGIKGTFQFYSLNSLGAFKNITEGKFESNMLK